MKKKTRNSSKVIETKHQLYFKDVNQVNINLKTDATNDFTECDSAETVSAYLHITRSR